MNKVNIAAALLAFFLTGCLEKRTDIVITQTQSPTASDIPTIESPDSGYGPSGNYASSGSYSSSSGSYSSSSGSYSSSSGSNSSSSGSYSSWIIYVEESSPIANLEGKTLYELESSEDAAGNHLRVHCRSTKYENGEVYVSDRDDLVSDETSCPEPTVLLADFLAAQAISDDPDVVSTIEAGYVIEDEVLTVQVTGELIGHDINENFDSVVSLEKIPDQGTNALFYGSNSIMMTHTDELMTSSFPILLSTSKSRIENYLNISSSQSIYSRFFDMYLPKVTGGFASTPVGVGLSEVNGAMKAELTFMSNTQLNLTCSDITSYYESFVFSGYDIADVTSSECSDDTNVVINFAVPPLTLNNVYSVSGLPHRDNGNSSVQAIGFNIKWME